MSGPSSAKPERPEGLPPGVDPLGVPREHGGREAFIVVLAVLLALLALIFTLGWLAFYRLTS